MLSFQMRLVRRVLLVLTVLLVGAPIPHVLAQDLGLATDDQQLMLARQARQQALDRLRSGTVPLEGAVNADEYIVGPGDVFTVTVGGALAMETNATVSADGRLVVADVGTFAAAGETLTTVQTRVKESLRRMYRNVSTDVALAQPREFFVHLSGAIPRPGRHVVAPIARVEDAVAAGMDNQSPLLFRRAVERELSPRTTVPGLRNVEVRRRDGTTFSVDLLRYYATGDTEHNPFLLDGDAIFVPGIEMDDDRRVFVERERGDPFAGNDTDALAIDYRPGDRVSTLLLIKGGPSLMEQTSRVQMLRTDNDGRVWRQDVDVAAIRNGGGEDPLIQPLDRVLIPGRDRSRGTAAVIGYVQHPGAYPVVDGVTTLRELIEAAGGLREGALLRGAYLERAGNPLGTRDRPSERSATAAAALMPEQARAAAEIERATYESARLSDLPFGSRQYLARELLHYQRLSLDLGTATEMPDIPLRDGDRLIIPRDPNAVLVIGQVGRPGYVPFREGMDAQYYVEQAGGAGPAATEVYVRELGSGRIRNPGTTALHSGEIVFVDRALIADTESLQALALQERQLEFQREQQRVAHRFQIVQTGVAVIGTIATLVTTYLLARNY